MVGEGEERRRGRRCAGLLLYLSLARRAKRWGFQSLRWKRDKVGATRGSAGRGGCAREVGRRESAGTPTAAAWAGRPRLGAGRPAVGLRDWRRLGFGGWRRHELEGRGLALDGRRLPESGKRGNKIVIFFLNFITNLKSRKCPPLILCLV